MNGICHFEIPSADFEKAKKFYGELFGWKFQDVLGPEYLIFNAPAGPGGGFAKGSEFISGIGFLFYIEVENIENTISNVEKLGGTCAKGKTQISPEIGHYAIITDLEGNHLGLWAKN